MFLEIFRFELRHQFRQPLFWLSAMLFFLLAFGAVTTDVVQLGGAIGNVNRNAPFVIMQTLLIMSILGVFVTTAFVASPILRDFESRTDGLFFSTPMTKFDYLLGRFSGAFVSSIVIFLSIALAIMVGSAMPWLEPERVGPFLLAPYAYGMAVIVIPNVLLMSAMSFSMATLTRSMMGTYGAVVAFFVAYVTAGTLLSDLENESLASLLDPFGAAAFGLATRYWTMAERNAALLPLEGPLLNNRLLWMGVAIAILAFAYFRFSFTASATKRHKKRAKEEVAEKLPTKPTRVAVQPVFTMASSFTQFLHQTRFEVLTMVKGAAFPIILVLGAFNLIGNSLVLDQIFGTPVYPVTHLMIQMIGGSFLLFVIIILTFYAGEIVWRDRGLLMADVHDAVPAPNWVYWGAKLIALFTVVLSVLAVSIVTAIGVQLAKGYTHLELGLYFKGIMLQAGAPFLLIAVLAIFFQVMSNNKYLGFLLMVLFFIAQPVLAALDFNHNLYLYAGAPAAPYSDMNGFGHFVKPVVWFYTYWTFAAGILVVSSHLFWVRGQSTGLGARMSLARHRLSKPVIWALTIAVIGFAGTGSYIFYNTNILNEYLPPDALQERQTRFEKSYKKFEGIPQPRITAVYTEVDIFPEERAVDIRGTYSLRNKTDVAIDSLHVFLNPQVELESISVPGASLELEDAELGYRIYRFTEPMEPGAELELDFTLAIRNPGFRNNGSNTQVVGNGTFLNSAQYFPHIGYSRQPELGDPVERRRRDLPEIQRMASINDESARLDNYISSESDWLDFEAVVSTSADQIALAPGYLVDEHEENGRKYFHYKMDAPILGFWAFLSARWEVRRDKWNDVDIAVYFHPDHDYNIDRMIYAVKRSLDYYTEEFGPYQHRQLRILEFPRYARFAQSFPNTIPFSESFGFITRFDDEDEIDYVFYVTAHEVAHQWWAHQVIGGNMQGSTIMSETMSQYSALMVMEREYGPEKMRRFLEYELNSYLRGRGGELIEELPLLLVENQGYIHYRKGSLVTYALKDYVGEQTLNEAFARYVEAVKFQEPPYTTALEYLDFVREVVPEDRAYIIEDLFETITLYEYEATDATYEPTDDGRFRVLLTVDSKKFRADGEGTETEIPVDDWVDVAVFGERGDDDPPEGKVLFMEKRHVTDAESVFEFIVDEEPHKAGIDPFHKLVDRNPSNNMTNVSVVEDG
ncbi:MAG: M1 family metallopeptidase [Gemmatimonadota bacterium]|nr:MAG: M1 family metallopeptidase [Gemmatimonadota bacterium]